MSVALTSIRSDLRTGVESSSEFGAWVIVTGSLHLVGAIPYVAVCQGRETVRPSPAKGLCKVGNCKWYPDPRKPLAIHSSYLATDSDRWVMVDSLKIVQQMASTEPLSDLIVERKRPDSASTLHHVTLDRPLPRRVGSAIILAAVPWTRRSAVPSSMPGSSASDRCIDYIDYRIQKHECSRDHDRQEEVS